MGGCFWKQSIEAFKSPVKWFQIKRIELEVILSPELIFFRCDPSRNNIFKTPMKNKWKKIREQLCVCVCVALERWALCARRSVVWERRHDEPLTHTNSANFRSVPSILLSHRTHVTNTHTSWSRFLRSFATVKLGARTFFSFSLSLFRFVFFLTKIITTQIRTEGRKKEEHCCRFWSSLSSIRYFRHIATDWPQWQRGSMFS